jgi:pimeloyl-ACP methyl ester carboxylesterase
MQNHVLRFALRALPHPLAARLMICAANRPPRPPVSAAEQAALEGSRELAYGAPAGRLARSWGTGPLVLLVHGWGGRAEQMAPLAKALAGAGYRAVALDVTGHGNSAGTATAWSHFVDDLASLARELQAPVRAIVGHSAGGLAAMVAQWHGLVEAERYVCIASPSYPYPPLEGVARRLAPPAGLLRRYRTYLADQLRAQWSQLEACEAFAGLGDRLLLIYDEKDRFVSHTQADRIASVCTGARVHKTSEYGHTRLLLAPQVREEVCRFVADDA